MHNLLKRSILILLLMAPLFIIAKDQVNVLFVKGNEQYAKSRYKEAAESYQQVLDAGYQSSAVYFNLGNANYKLGNMAAAILNYEKAYKLTPGDDDIRVNLQLANSKITDKAEDVPEFFLAKWWKESILFFSPLSLSVFSIIFFTLGFLLLIVYLFAQAIQIKKPAFYAGILLAFLGLCGVFMLNIQDNYFNSHQEAIVFAGTINVKSGPNDTQKTLFVLHEGTKVRIRETNNEWIKVELPNGNIGWIESSGVKEI